jgi:MFS family permease
LTSAVTFRGLLRHNHNVRRLWLGQVVSQLGDWFNAVAVYALLLDLTGSATSVAAMIVVQMLPNAIIGPLAGVVVDRRDRRRVMIAADLARGVVILFLLLVRDAGTVWIAYVAMGLAVVAQAFFEPARSAILPTIAQHDDLVPANSLSAATWSAMLAIGAAVGGAITAWFGRETAFVLNSASFFASAWFIARIAVPPREPAEDSHAGHAARPGLGEGLAWVRRHRAVAALISVKGAWALAGGVMLLLTVYGERVFRTADSTAAGIGILYAARGVGAGAGALVAKALLERGRDTMTRFIGPSYFVIGLFYVGLGLAPDIWSASLAVIGAHVAWSIIWVTSTVMLQMNVPDRYRGRVFGIDFSLMTLMSALSSYLTAVGLDHLHFSPRAMAVVLGALFFVPAVPWLIAHRRRGLS